MSMSLRVPRCCKCPLDQSWAEVCLFVLCLGQSAGCTAEAGSCQNQSCWTACLPGSVANCKAHSIVALLAFQPAHKSIRVFSNHVQTQKQVCRAQTTLAPLNHWAARYNTWLLIELTPKGLVFSLQGCVIKGAGAWGCYSPLARHNNMRYGPTARQLPC